MSRWRARIRHRQGALQLSVDLAPSGSVLALAGPNGSGKTTLLRILAGALRADHAHITVGAEVWADADRKLHRPPEARRVGYLPQGYGLFPHLDVLDNMAFGLSTGAARRPRAERRAHARAVLAELGASDLAERSVAALSGGQQQRVALARALAAGPTLLLLDEPLAALDVTHRRSVRQLLAERLPALPCPSVVVTHDRRDLQALGAEVVVLDGGRVVQTGTVEALQASPATPFVAELVG